MLHGIEKRPEDHERMHRHLQNAANERGRRSANCLGCGQRFEPEIAQSYDCQRCSATVLVGVGARGLCNDCLNVSQDERSALIRGDIAPTPDLIRARRGANVETWPRRAEPEHDFRLHSEGPRSTVFRLVPLTDAAEAWVNDNVGTEGYQPCYPTLYVEHGYIEALLEGIGEAGLIVDVDQRVLA